MSERVAVGNWWKLGWSRAGIGESFASASVWAGRVQNRMGRIAASRRVVELKREKRSARLVSYSSLVGSRSF